MPDFQFDKKFGAVTVALHPFRVRNNLQAFKIPFQLTKDSQVKVSGVKMPKFYVVGVFAAGKPMVFRFEKAEDLGKLPGIFDLVKGMLEEFVEEIGSAYFYHSEGI